MLGTQKKGGGGSAPGGPPPPPPPIPTPLHCDDLGLCPHCFVLCRIFSSFLFFPYPQKLNDNEKLWIYGISLAIDIPSYRLKDACMVMHHAKVSAHLYNNTLRFLKFNGEDTRLKKKMHTFCPPVWLMSTIGHWGGGGGGGEGWRARELGRRRGLACWVCKHTILKEFQLLVNCLIVSSNCTHDNITVTYKRGKKW